ncbi:hypothetical protein [Micropruina sp.]|uniref:hypothetical protein n=1 Tax=Micropruina sp. TaxID=2737536 RepID=UPI0039E3A5E2
MAESTENRLLALQALVEQAKAVPMSATCMVNRAEVLALIEQALTSHADELSAAKDEANASPPVLQRARVEAEQIVQAAEAKAEQLVEAASVLTTARERAGELESKAIAEADGLRREADVYVDGRMATLEAGLQKTLSQIQTMRARLAARSGLDGEPSA